MPGFTSRDDMINEITTNGKTDIWNFYKSTAQAPAIGVWQTLWKGVGQPGAGADPATTPGTAYVSDASTPVAGSVWFPDRSTDLRYMTSAGCTSNQSGTLMIYDRLEGVSGLSIASTGSKTANTSAIDRYSSTSADKNEVWLEVTTALTTTAAIVNLNSYTTADGTTAQTGGSVTFPSATAAIGTMVQLPMSATKTGVRSVEAGLNVGTAAATGIVNLVILRRLALIPVIANIYNEISFLDDTMGLPRVFDNATIGLAFLPTAATSPTYVWGQINCAYG